MVTESMAKPKATGASRASEPRKSATKSNSPPKAAANAKPSSESKRAQRVSFKAQSESSLPRGAWAKDVLIDQDGVPIGIETHQRRGASG